MAFAGYLVRPRRAMRPANDNGLAPAREVIRLPPLAQTGARRNGPHGLVLFVEEGVVEVMIGGAAGHVTAGGFVAVPAGATYACRNAGDETARLESRRVDAVTSTTAA